MLIAGVIILVIGIAVTVIVGGVTDWKFGSSVYEYEMKTYQAETEVDNLNVDFYAGELKIVYGDVENIKIEYPESKRYTVKIETTNGALSATIGKRRWYDFISWGQDYPVTTVTLPRSARLNLNVEMNAGKAQVEGGTYKDVYLKMNAGELDLGKLKCDLLTCSVNAGKIDLDGAQCNRAILKTNAGEIVADKLDCPEIEAKINAGNIKVDILGDESDYSIITKINAGSCNKSDRVGATDKKIQAEINAGSLNVNFDN